MPVKIVILQQHILILGLVIRKMVNEVDALNYKFVLDLVGMKTKAMNLLERLLLLVTVVKVVIMVQEDFH